MKIFPKQSPLRETKRVAKLKNLVADTKLKLSVESIKKAK
jgi:hypothetical protein